MFNSETAKFSENYLDSLEGIRNLPFIPLVISEVHSKLDKPMTSAAELAETISKDQGLVAKILTIANSTIYGLPGKVSTIEFAIVILGFENIKNIVVALSMVENLMSKNDRFWNKKNYWNHSLNTAKVAKRIADELGYQKSGTAFTAGLLHDLGISVIQRHFNKEFISICKAVEEKQILYVDAETEIMNTNHQEIGYFLADKWNLPKSLSETILHHHNPGKCNDNENKILASIIHLSDFITEKFAAEKFLWDKNIKLDNSIIDILRLGDENYLYEFIDSYSEILSNNLETIKC